MVASLPTVAHIRDRSLPAVLRDYPSRMHLSKHHTGFERLCKHQTALGLGNGAAQFFGRFDPLVDDYLNVG